MKQVHDHNHVHRDIKPQNIMLGEDDIVKLGDFGLTEQTRQRRDLESPQLTADLALAFSKHPMMRFCGTMIWMSNEAVAGFPR